MTDQVGVLLLQTALESFDRVRGAEHRIKADGLVVTGRDGQPKTIPCSPWRGTPARRC